MIESCTGIAIDQTCNNGLTALHIASRENRLHNVRELITWGADVNAKDNNGIRTPLFFSIDGLWNYDRTNQKQVIELLLERGTDLNQKFLREQRRPIKRSSR